MKTFGGALDEIVEGVVGPDGEIYVSGGLAGSADLGGGTIGGFGDLDAFVARYDSDGTHRWSIAFGGAGSTGGGGAWTTAASTSLLLLLEGALVDRLAARLLRWHVRRRPEHRTGQGRITRPMTAFGYADPPPGPVAEHLGELSTRSNGSRSGR